MCNKRSAINSCALVTGVAGFIGSHLAERVISEGHNVIGLDCFTDHYPRRVKEHNLKNLRGHKHFKFIEADLLDLDLGSLLGGDLTPDGWGDVDYVFHHAAQAGVRRSWGREFETYCRNNIWVTQRLLEAAREVPLKKFVCASSSSVYGDVEVFPISEDVTPRPVSPYGVTKLAGEHLCLLYWRNYGVPVVCLRYFTVYGPRQRPDMAFHRFIQAILDGQGVVVYGDGEQTRDFTYVDDAVEGTVRAALTDVEGQVFNIGGGSRVAVNYVIGVLEEILGRPTLRRYAEAQAGDMRHTAADIYHAKAVLGYVPSISLQDGLKKQVDWMCNSYSA